MAALVIAGGFFASSVKVSDKLFPKGNMPCRTCKRSRRSFGCRFAECEMIRDLATHTKKRELFAKLAEHYGVLAAEVERALSDGSSQSPS